MQQRSGNPALKWGLIFGGIGAVLDLINAGIRAASHNVAIGSSGAFSGSGCIFSLIGLALFFTAGLLAARDSGRVGSGAVAGLIAGLVSGVVSTVAGIIAIVTLSEADLSAAAAQV